MDIVSRHDRSRIMASVKSSANTSTEKAFIAILKRNNITGWRRKCLVHGRPDFVFPISRVAVFIDGCFWHNCPQHCRFPSTNIEYWKKKIFRNEQRDKEVTYELKKKGWKVLRFWEHDLKGGKTLLQNLRRLKRLTQLSDA